MNGKIVEVITKIGLAGITLVALIILYQVLTNDLSHIGEYIQENTAVLVGVKEAVESNTKQNERVERVITNLEQRIR